MGRFTVVLRGYDTGEVDAVIARVESTATWTDPTRRAAVRRELNGIRLPTRLRGYDRAQVDDYLARLAAAVAMAVVDDGPTRGSPVTAADMLNALAPGFTVVLRGYDKAEVDAVAARANAALISNDAAQRALAVHELNGVRFRTRLWGYDRIQVDEFLQGMAAALALPGCGDR